MTEPNEAEDRRAPGVPHLGVDAARTIAQIILNQCLEDSETVDGTVSGDASYADQVLADRDDFDVLAVLDAARRLKRATDLAVKACEEVLAGRLGDQDWRVGDRLLRSSSVPQYRVDDPAGLADWLADRYRDVVALTTSTQIRRSALTAVAEERGLDPETVFNTFTSTNWGPRRLSELPLSRAPAYAAGIPDGGYRLRRAAPPVNATISDGAPS